MTPSRTRRFSYTVFSRLLADQPLSSLYRSDSAPAAASRLKTLTQASPWVPVATNGVVRSSVHGLHARSSACTWASGTIFTMSNPFPPVDGPAITYYDIVL